MTTDPTKSPAQAAPLLRRLPTPANLEQLRKQAKDLLHQHERQQSECCEVLRWLNRFALSQDVRILSSEVALHEAQDAIAMSYGFRNWQAIHEWVEQGPAGAITPEQLELEASGAWQEALERLANVAGVPIAIIHRLEGPFIEVIADNGAADNPLKVGDRRHWQDSGLYFEMVIKTLAPLAVADARQAPDWSGCPLIEQGLITYVGVPIAAPDGTIFGVLSLLARQPHPHPGHAVEALEAIQALLESQLRQIAQLRQLGARVLQLSDLLIELRTIREIITLCSYCKRVRDASGQWQPIEELLESRTGAKTSHGICPDCQQHVTDATDPEP